MASSRYGQNSPAPRRARTLLRVHNALIRLTGETLPWPSRVRAWDSA